VRADRVITDRMGATFEVVVRDRATGRSRTLKPLRLPMLGQHNVQNALAAIAIGSRWTSTSGAAHRARRLQGREAPLHPHRARPAASP
jgi:UDP-N-acetylmuramate--alanine ligase